MKFVFIKDPLEPDEWGKWINADLVVAVSPQLDTGEGRPISVIGSVIQCVGGAVFFTGAHPDDVLGAINGADGAAQAKHGQEAAT